MIKTEISTEKLNGEVKIKKLKSKMEKWKIKKRNHYVAPLGFTVLSLSSSPPFDAACHA